MKEKLLFLIDSGLTQEQAIDFLKDVFLKGSRTALEIEYGNLSIHSVTVFDNLILDILISKEN